jgi:hypothetical protein
MMTRAEVEALPIEICLRILVGGSVTYVDDDDREVIREFSAGEIVTILDVDYYDDGRNLTVTFETDNGIVDWFDRDDFNGLYPFALIEDGNS